MKVIKGMKVHILTKDRSEYLGTGKIIEINENNPIIKLDNKKDTYSSSECWWGLIHPEDPNKVIVLSKDDVDEITETLNTYMNLPLYKRIELWIQYQYNNLSTKSKRTVKLIPRIVILMVLSSFFAGFIYSINDLLMYVFAIILLGLFLFFVPLNKLLNYED